MNKNFYDIKLIYKLVDPSNIRDDIEKNVVPAFLNNIVGFENPIVSGLIENNYTGKKFPIPMSLKKLLDKTSMSLNDYLVQINTFTFTSAETTLVWNEICDGYYSNNFLDDDTQKNCECEQLVCKHNSLRRYLNLYGQYLLNMHHEAPKPILNFWHNTTMIQAIMEYISDLGENQIKNANDLNAIAHGFALGFLSREKHFLDEEKFTQGYNKEMINYSIKKKKILTLDNFFAKAMASGFIENKYTHKKLSIPMSLKRLLDKTSMSLNDYLAQINTLNTIDTKFVWNKICDIYTKKYVDRDTINYCVCNEVKCDCNSYESRLETYGLYLLDRNRIEPKPLFSNKENILLVKAIIDYIEEVEIYNENDFNAIAHVFILELLGAEEDFVDAELKIT